MRKELLQYKALAKFLKDALGERYEIVLRSADDLGSAMKIENRTLVKSDSENTAVNGFLADILNSSELKKRDYLCSFSEDENAPAGQKNSFFYIRDKKGEIIGFLCIYEKENNYVTVREVLDQMLEPENEDLQSVSDTSRRVGEEVDALMRERIAEVWSRHKIPGKRMQKADKLAFILELLETGIFRMKGAAIQVSKVTGISQASIYRYLGEVVEE